MFYIVQLDPRVVAGDSQQFIREEVRRSSQSLQAAQTRLDEALSLHGPDPDDYAGAMVVTRAEENFERARVIHDAVLLKFHWENSDRWMEAEALRRDIAKSAKKTPKAFVRPWIEDACEWLKIFTPRNIKPTSS